MTTYREVLLGDLFEAVNGKATFIRDYIDHNPGEYPVYSASLTKPFGYIDTYDYEGPHLTWVMNGYGGRVQEVDGRFSINRDRGVLIPRSAEMAFDLTYIRYAIEPELTANAVGRRVDGQLNEYTKIYPTAAASTSLQIPITASGDYDYEKMAAIGARIRRVEKAQSAVRTSREALERVAFLLDVPEPSATLSLGDDKFFRLSIGKRVLQSEHSREGIPAYSANALIPFGMVSASNLEDFSSPSLLWGIDGNFDWNLIPANHEFATTDHCGRVQLLDSLLDPEYIYWYLRTTGGRYGFDRVYRAKLENIKSDVTVQVPLDLKSGRFSLQKQKVLAAHFRKQEAARILSIESLDNVMKARVPVVL